MAVPATYNEKEILSKVAMGDAVAFEVLFHEYNSRLFRFIKKIVKSENIAEEIVQEVFLRVWLNKDKLQELEKPGAWIFLIASNLSITHLRNAANEAKKRRYALETQDVSADLVTQLDAGELKKMIDKAIGLLPQKRQQIYRMSRQEGLTHKEIAGLLSISTNTVKDHLVLSLKFIREYIRLHSGQSIAVFTLISLI